jgi:6-phosphogluconolactonase
MGGTIGRIEVLPDPLALAHHVAAWMTQAALASQGPFRVSLSGGSTPKTLYGLLASDEFRSRFPWPRISWYWGDERFVPHDHPDSNYRMVREAMLSKAEVPPGNIYPIPTDGTSKTPRGARRIADAYGAQRSTRNASFDVHRSGLGSTESLFLREPVRLASGGWCCLARPARGTDPAHPSSNATAAAGERRRSSPDRRQQSVPVARVQLSVGELFWFVDQAAAPKNTPRHGARADVGKASISKRTPCSVGGRLRSSSPGLTADFALARKSRSSRGRHWIHVDMDGRFVYHCRAGGAAGDPPLDRKAPQRI